VASHRPETAAGTAEREERGPGRLGQGKLAKAVVWHWELVRQVRVAAASGTAVPQSLAGWAVPAAAMTAAFRPD